MHKVYNTLFYIDEPELIFSVNFLGHQVKDTKDEVPQVITLL